MQIERVNTKKQVAERAGLSLRSVERIIGNHEIAVVQLSNRRVGVLESDFMAYLQSRRRPAAV